MLNHDFCHCRQVGVSSVGACVSNERSQMRAKGNKMNQKHFNSFIVREMFVDSPKHMAQICATSCAGMSYVSRCS